MSVSSAAEQARDLESLVQLLRKLGHTGGSIEQQHLADEQQMTAKTYADSNWNWNWNWNWGDWGPWDPAFGFRYGRGW
jgi:hypothetical protein